MQENFVKKEDDFTQKGRAESRAASIDLRAALCHINPRDSSVLRVLQCLKSPSALVCNIENTKIRAVNHCAIPCRYRGFWKNSFGLFTNFHFIIILFKRLRVTEKLRLRIRHHPHENAVFRGVLFSRPANRRCNELIKITVTPDKEFHAFLSIQHPLYERRESLFRRREAVYDPVTKKTDGIHFSFSACASVLRFLRAEFFRK